MSKLVIFGAGQTAEIVHHYFKYDSPHEVVAFAVNQQMIKESSFLGKPIVPFETIEKEFPKDQYKMHSAASYTDCNGVREKMYNQAKEKGYELVTFISSKAGIIGDRQIGDNCVILENQLIQPFAKIGNNVALWNGVLVGHHSSVEDHCWITSGANIGGNCRIGERSFLGMNSTIAHMVTLGRECFLGAGCLVTKTAPDYSVYIQKETERFKLDSRKFMLITKMR